MPEQIAEWIWAGLAVYAALGASVSAVLMLGLLQRIDPLAADAPWRVKALIAPGLVALWPIMLVLLIRPKLHERRS